MTGSRTPALSAIVITLGGFDVIRRTVRHLHDQTGRDQIELLIVTPSAKGLEYDPKLVAGFHSVRVIEAGSINYTGEGHAAGVRAASAPVVIYVEEHSYPEPGWAEALIKAHDGPWDAVGGVILNANPRSMVSWASMLTDFGPWVAPVQGGEVDRLPPHHTSYKKTVLEEYGSRLAPLLESETVLIANLNKQGPRRSQAMSTFPQRGRIYRGSFSAVVCSARRERARMDGAFVAWPTPSQHLRSRWSDCSVW
jgi:hypothetical protein